MKKSNSELKLKLLSSNCGSTGLSLAAFPAAEMVPFRDKAESKAGIFPFRSDSPPANF